MSHEDYRQTSVAQRGALCATATLVELDLLTHPVSRARNIFGHGIQLRCRRTARPSHFCSYFEHRRPILVRTGPFSKGESNTHRNSAYRGRRQHCSEIGVTAEEVDDRKLGSYFPSHPQEVNDGAGLRIFCMIVFEPLDAEHLGASVSLARPPGK